MFFPVIMCRFESWTVRKAEFQRIDTFEPWCSRRLLRVPLRARRSNQSILKEINLEFSLIGLLMKLSSHVLATWFDKLTHGKDPHVGKDWKQKEKWVAEDEIVGWHHQFNGHEFEQTLGNSGGERSLVCCSPWGHKELDTT